MSRCCPERGLHLVAQIADIAAAKFKRQVTIAMNDDCFKPRLQHCKVACGSLVRRGICRVVRQHRPLRRAAHEGEACGVLPDALTIQPEAVVAVGIEAQEDIFGIEIRARQPPSEGLELDATRYAPTTSDSRGRSGLSDTVSSDRRKPARGNLLPGMSMGLVPKIGNDPHAM